MFRLVFGLVEAQGLLKGKVGGVDSTYLRDRQIRTYIPERAQKGRRKWGDKGGLALVMRKAFGFGTRGFVLADDPTCLTGA